MGISIKKDSVVANNLPAFRIPLAVSLYISQMKSLLSMLCLYQLSNATLTPSQDCFGTGVSTVIGQRNKVDGEFDAVIGNTNDVMGSSNGVFGDNNLVRGNGNLAGLPSDMNSHYNSILGNQNTANGMFNAIMGNRNDIAGSSNGVFGCNNVVEGDGNLVEDLVIKSAKNDIFSSVKKQYQARKQQTKVKIAPTCSTPPVIKTHTRPVPPSTPPSPHRRCK